MSQKRPNFLIIVADDLGFSDIQPFGSEINTPNLEALARDGLRFTGFHTAAACSPTRSMLFSGTDNHLAGVGAMAEYKKRAQKTGDHSMDVEGYEGYLNDRVAALPEILSQESAGYETIISGKWHLGLTPETGPRARGFEKSSVLLPGAASHFAWDPELDRIEKEGLLGSIPSLYTKNGEKVKFPPNKDSSPEGFYSTDFFTNELLDFLSNRTTDNEGVKKPFLSLLTYTAPHWPLQVYKEYRDKYKGFYDDGPEALRQRRLQALQKAGLVNEDVVPHEVVAPEQKEWEEMTPEEKAKSSRAMETYAGMVERLDWNIGRVLDFLKETGDYDNTFIVFMADNGAEGASYEAAPVMGPNIMKAIATHFDNSLDNIGNYNSFVWYGPRWAQASTAPSRLYKMFSAEGGILVPFILRYPPFFQPNHQPGSIVTPFSTVMDLVPTILEISGVQHPYPNKFQGRAILPVKGKSWVPYFSDSGVEKFHSTETITGWELHGRAAVRKDNFKLTYIPPPHGKGTWELFDLDKDPGETEDLADLKEFQEIKNELLIGWENYVKDNRVVWVGHKRGEKDVVDDSKAWMHGHKGSLISSENTIQGEINIRGGDGGYRTSASRSFFTNSWNIINSFFSVGN